MKFLKIFIIVITFFLFLKESVSEVFASCPPGSHPEATIQRWANTQASCEANRCFISGTKEQNLGLFECCCLSGSDEPNNGQIYTEKYNFCQSNRECTDCFSAGNSWTAIGCIPTNDLNEFAGWIIGKVIFVASGIAFLLMTFGTFQVITSSGDPKKAQAGKELITSALSGLLFIILSVFLLKLIGVDILRIPGFGS